ncbi:MAG TPA: MarR family transcriptional regulator, partial [Longimicrobiaceae bacterium]|nr:MarR family transcriptional regulator [Longimicrobiaceae bacterium]
TGHAGPAAVTVPGEMTAETTRGPRSPAQDRALKLWVVLNRARESLAAHLHEDAARHDLTLTEFGILEVLYHKGPMLLGEVQRRILVSSGGVTYLIDRLVSKGLVERRACPEDRRARYAALTGEGEAVIREIFPEHAERIEELLAVLGPDEQAEAIALLRRLGLSAADSKEE